MNRGFYMMVANFASGEIEEWWPENHSKLSGSILIANDLKCLKK